jgi:hypothetical protein
MAPPPATVVLKSAKRRAPAMVRTVLFPPSMRFSTALVDRDLSHYFEYSKSGVDVVSDGLQELRFGEYLVEQKILDRVQLFRAMQMQDRNPGARIGECAAALGYARIHEIERAYRRFAGLTTVLVA